MKENSSALSQLKQYILWSEGANWKKKKLDFSSAQVKFCEVHVNFKMASQFLFNFCITLHCYDTYNSTVNLKPIHFLLGQILHHSSMSWKITPLYFFSSSNIYFCQKEPILKKLFRLFECSGQILWSSC